MRFVAASLALATCTPRTPVPPPYPTTACCPSRPPAQHVVTAQGTVAPFKCIYTCEEGLTDCNGDKDNENGDGCECLCTTCMPSPSGGQQCGARSTVGNFCSAPARTPSCLDNRGAVSYLVGTSPKATPKSSSLVVDPAPSSGTFYTFADQLMPQYGLYPNGGAYNYTDPTTGATTLERRDVRQHVLLRQHLLVPGVQREQQRQLLGWDLPLRRGRAVHRRQPTCMSGVCKCGAFVCSATTADTCAAGSCSCWGERSVLRREDVRRRKLHVTYVVRHFAAVRKAW